MKLRNIIIIIFSSIIVDQVTKYLVSMNFTLEKEYELIKDFYYITYYKNTGIAFGMFQNIGLLIIIISITLLLLLIYELWMNYKDRVAALALSFLIGGLIGNLIDRIFLGYVRDFIDFNPFGLNFPIFNISDACIVIGACILVVNILSIGVKDGKVKNK